MNFLIRLVGRLVARRIERGSRGGAVTGVLLAIGVTAVLYLLEITSRYTVATGIFLAIAFGVAGSAFGAVRRQRPSRGRWPQSDEQDE